MRRSRSARMLAACLAGLALLAGCAGDDDDTPSQAATPSAPTPTTAPPQLDPSPGCGTSTAAAVDRERRTVAVDGAERWYLLSVPPAHDGRTPLPLVVEFHGLAEGAAIAAQMSQFDQLGDREGIVTVFPHGTGSPVKWNERLDASPNSDFRFVEELLGAVGRDLCIDRRRVYATGLSYGAIMSSSLACVMADRFAAIAPVAGITFPEGCRPSRPMPVLSFHGTKDPILWFNGGVGDLGAALRGGSPTPQPTPPDLEGAGYPATIRRWAAQNGCDATPTDARTSPRVVTRSYRCPAGADVTFTVVEEGGHSWPGSEFSKSIERIVGPTTFEIDATAQIWDFFRDRRR